MKDVRDAMATILDSTSLADVLHQVEKASAQKTGVPTYQI